MTTYIPYILIEFVSNLALKAIGPRFMLPGLCVAWGIVTTCQCLVNNYTGLIICRVFLGLCEGGLFPGFVLYLSFFYKRQELQKRIGCIYGAAAVSGAFSGLLAAAIIKLNGVGGLAGWRWIFLLEGAVTIVFGLLIMLVLPNTPMQVLVFKPEEAHYATQRLIAEARVEEDSHISIKAVISTFREPHVINMSIIGFCNGIVISGIAYFTPSIVQALGYGPTQTQLLSVPPYACAFVLTMIAAWFADKYGRRGFTALATLSLAIVACILNLTCTSIGARYTAQCLLVASIYSTAPSLLTWVPNNTATYGRRATAVAIVFVTSNAAGMVAMWLYPTKTAPRYLFATKFNLVTICIELICLVIQIVLLRRLNQAKEDRREELLRPVAGSAHEEQMEILGDHHPDFKYVL
jgi:MFS family permease